jgi:ATP-dependent Clp protease ATP-binding subunit ClpA
VIDEAGAAQRILPEASARRPSARPRSRTSWPRSPHPAANVSNDDRSKLQTLERDLKSVVFGQDKALEVLASAVKMARSGLGKPTSRSAPSCSPAPPASARPKWPSSWPTSWASS